MYKTIIPFVLLLVFLTCAYAQDKDIHNLAEEYPNETLFMAMVMRGATDYSTVNQRHAVSMSDYIKAGFTAYYPPVGLEFVYRVVGDQAEIGPGTGTYTDGANERDLQLTIIRVLDREDTFTMSTGYVPVVSDGQITGYEETELKSWNYKGAQWYDAGESWDTVAEALRFDRIWAHLTWATSSYQAIQREMPESFSQVEEFMGVERNPVAWEGVTVVDSVDDVGESAGNLFVGWSDDKWVISINTGPEVKTSEYVRDNCTLWWSCGLMEY